MASYAIGDIQGCYKTLKRLLKRIAFDPKNDRIFLVGDMVNRGPDSLEVLRWAADPDNRVTTVLGNHDLYLLALAEGVSSAKRVKLLEPILKARDGDKLIKWLRKRPILHLEDNFVIVHAGILPAWTIEQAQSEARKIEELLRSDQAKTFLELWYKKEADVWSDDLTGMRRSAVALNALTRMRMCKSAHEMEFEFTGKPKDAPAGLTPWFQVKSRPTTDPVIIFGHWAALGLKISPQTVALDSGCVWGETLTAYRIEDGSVYSEPSADR